LKYHTRTIKEVPYTPVYRSHACTRCTPEIGKKYWKEKEIYLILYSISSKNLPSNSTFWDQNLQEAILTASLRVGECSWPPDLRRTRNSDVCSKSVLIGGTSAGRRGSINEVPLRWWSMKNGWNGKQGWI